MTFPVSLLGMLKQSRRNNHLHMHRRDLRDAVKGTHPPVRLLALNWSLDLPHAEIHRICADRILARGANHQTLHGDENSKAHESVIWQFLHTTEPLADDEADTVIEMDVREDLEHALSRAIDAVVRVLGLPRPDAERVGAALARHAGIAPRAQTAQAAVSRSPPRLRDTSAFPPRSTSSTRWTPTSPSHRRRRVRILGRA
jgi:tRNA ligase